MIRDKDSAKKVNELVLKVGKELNSSILEIDANLSESELNNYKLAVGKVMGEILFEIMNPLYKEHPDLKPEGLD